MVCLAHRAHYKVQLRLFMLGLPAPLPFTTSHLKQGRKLPVIRLSCVHLVGFTNPVIDRPKTPGKSALEQETHDRGLVGGGCRTVGQGTLTMVVLSHHCDV